MSTRYGKIPVTETSLWGHHEDRSRGRYFHGFLFVNEWLDFLLQSRNEEYLEHVVSLIDTWWKNNPISSRHDSGMAYHDETTAQRANNLLALYLIADSTGSNESKMILRTILDATTDLLSEPGFHAGSNNHGMFQDLAVRNYCLITNWLDEADRQKRFSISTNNLKNYFISSFTDEGVHVENTPTYHLMVSRNLQNHVDLLTLLNHDDAPLLSDLLKRAGDYATHSVMPNGMYPPVSDTTIMSLQTYSANSFDSNFEFAATAGAKGIRPKGLSKVYPKSGYAIYRSDWDDKNATYLFFSAAYNNNYHKHSDDLSFVLYAAGSEVISEAGPYSYNYKDPYSQYAYSQFAHNNIIVDGKSTRRTDHNSKTVKIVSHSINSSNFEVEAETGRLAGVRHSRQISITGDPREETIIVTDSLTASETHTYDMLWNVAPGYEPILHGNGFELFDGESKVLDAIFSAAVPMNVTWHAAEESPAILGWKFPAFGKKKPGGVIRVRFTASGDVTVVGKFALKDWSYVNRGLQTSTGQGWKRFIHTRGLNFLPAVPANSTEKMPLVFVFSAMMAVGDFSYNYKTTLDSVRARVIYLLDDFGDQGSYYLQEHGNLDIFDTVQKFIASKIEEFSESTSGVFFLGSSKGGTAAIIHGRKFENARIIVGAPQTRIASFVSKPHPNVLRYMTGADQIEGAAELDGYLFDPGCFPPNRSRITILVGKADHHYKNHVLPWMEFARSAGLDASMVALEGTPHSEIGAAYRKFLKTMFEKAEVQEKKLESSDIPIGTWYDSVSDRIFVTVPPSTNSQFSFRLYRNNNLIKSVPYSKQNYTSWDDLIPDRYRVRVFVKSERMIEPVKKTGPWVQVKSIK